MDCSYRRCPFWPELNGIECNGHGTPYQAFDERGQWGCICKCHDGWSGKACHESYASATQALSTPPPSFWAAPHTQPQGVYVTNQRKHIILGSEGYTEGRQGQPNKGIGNAANQGGMDTDIGGNFQGKVGSYQSPETWIRSDDYNAGQHPTNKNCLTLGTGTFQIGCQHSVTHPQQYTGNPWENLNGLTAQPSGPSNYDPVPDGNWRLGEHVSASHTFHSPNPDFIYQNLGTTPATTVPQTVTPKESVATVHDHLPGQTGEGIQFSAPTYSGHYGHHYVPKYTKQSNDVGHST